MPTAPPDTATIARWQQVRNQLGSTRKAAAALGISSTTVQKYTTAPDVWNRKGAEVPHPVMLPDPAPEAGGPALPDPVALSYEPYRIDTPGRWLVLGDVHLPYHDKRTVEAAVEDARKGGAVGVLLNGDILDCGEVSDHFREPSEPRLEEEIDTGVRFLAYLRSRLPRARIVWKEGNHEWRIPRYLANNAPALYGSKFLAVPKLLDHDKYGVEWVADQRIVRLGRLPVLHGHEFGRGGASGVNPARWLFLKTISTAMCGHFHRTSEHHEPDIEGRVHGVWSVGCACYLHPRFLRNNKWNLGWATVSIQSDGHGFTVENRRVIQEGRVV